MQLHRQRKEFEKAGIQIVVVSFEILESTRKYLENTSLRWPVLVDGQKILYRYFGMGEAGFWDIWGFRTWRSYIKEILLGRLPRKGGGDIRQRGGNVIVDPGGRIRLHHIATGPGDRPEAETLLQFVKEEDQKQFENDIDQPP